MFVMRRRLERIAIVGVLLMAVCGNAWGQPGTDGADFKVTLLSTGSPSATYNRFGPSVLVQAGGETLLFDCGRGVTQRLFQLGVKLGSANKLFLTHLHSDHVVGIPDLWLTGWLEFPAAQRMGPFHAYGPAGTKTMMDHLEQAFAWDIETRVADQKLPRDNVTVAVTEYQEGVVYENHGVKVTAFAVDHGDAVKPAYGSRIDYDGRSAVLSGDTRFNESLIRHAMGVDLLVHQVAAVRPELLESPVFKVILAHHTKPDEAGILFSRTKPRQAAFYHFSLLGTPKVPPMTVEEVVAQARTKYGGPLVAGEDLMEFQIGHGGATVKGH